MIRRSCYEKVGYYDELLRYEDRDMWLRITQHFDFSYSPKVLSRYRLVGNSLTNSLHVKENPRRYHDHFIIYHKCLSYAKCDTNQRKWLIRKLENDSLKLYQHGEKCASHFIWKAFVVGRHFEILLYAVLSSMGVPYRQSFIVLRKFNKIKGYLNWRVRSLLGK